MSLTHEDVTEILRIVEASRADEVVLELEDLRLTVLRQPDTPRTATAGRAEAETRPGPVHVTAPTVGTVRLRAAPGEAPFVEVGATVAAGQPLCRIELMGDGVTVSSPAAGTLRIVSGVDGASVEFGQVLFTIEPQDSRGKTDNE